MPGATLPGFDAARDRSRASVYSLVSIVRCDGGLRGHWETNRNSRSSTRSIAFNEHFTAVGVQDVAHDRQTQTEAALRAHQRAVGLPVCFKGFRQMLRGDTDPGVSDRNFEMSTVLFRTDAHEPARRREFDGIDQ